MYIHILEPLVLLMPKFLKRIKKDEENFSKKKHTKDPIIKLAANEWPI